MRDLNPMRRFRRKGTPLNAIDAKPWNIAEFSTAVQPPTFTVVTCFVEWHTPTRGGGGVGVGGGGVFAKCLCVRNIADDGSYTFGVKRLRYEPRYTGVIRLDNPFIYCYFFSGAGLL